ncbi:hypothetical Protein YC6258_00284 [Gynuella sunshinyii YC6258]|uniref:Uncharacterized protein n=1 Tax=Gynuella sunshinyii YC6258 TaxID=1445510 RepID=A0A0C5VPZ2_9GAMM|nr:hypothetical Protein YC6258_00284 [Gynuella sunshinyii YC6258]
MHHFNRGAQTSGQSPKHRPEKHEFGAFSIAFLPYICRFFTFHIGPRT